MWSQDKMPTVCFDLEGPLSPQDNAYEVMGTFENGYSIFEVISRYDDILTLEGREGYEPGDTLKLIVPFLLYHGVTEEDIAQVSQRAKVVEGVKETVDGLKSDGFRVHIISTSYSQHALNIASQLGIGSQDVACTRLPLDEFRTELDGEDMERVRDIEARFLSELKEASDEVIKTVLDGFFFEDLKGTAMGTIFDGVEVVGGARKVWAMEDFARADGTSLDNVVAVGDSITDFKMLETVKDAGGLAVVFNGNRYSIPYGDLAVATLDMRCLLPIFSAFEKGGREEAMGLIDRLVRWDTLAVLDENMSLSKTLKENPPVYHNLTLGNDPLEDIIRIHKEFRTLVRGEAGKLG